MAAGDPFTPYVKGAPGRITGVGQGRAAKSKDVDDAMLLMEQSSSVLNMSHIAQVMLLEFGGPTPFAQEFRKAFDKTKAGSTARTNMLKSMMAIMNLGAPKGNVGDMSDLSDEDLEKTVIALFQKAMANKPQGVPGAETQANQAQGTASTA